MIDIWCPICEDLLVDDTTWSTVQSTTNPPRVIFMHNDKSCSKRTSHKFYIKYGNSFDEKTKSILFIDHDNKCETYWNYNQHVSILRWYGEFMSENPIILPFFEPDFSDLKKMYNKIKLYTVFK